jgi:hypothetical protein
MNTKPRTLTSFLFNVSDCTLVQVYGVGTYYSVSYTWNGTPPCIHLVYLYLPASEPLIRQRKRRSLTSPNIFRCDQTARFPGEQLMWSMKLDRMLTYLVEVDIFLDGGQWGVSRVVVSNSM